MGIVLILLILAMGFLLYKKLVPAILALPLFSILIGIAALTPTAAKAFSSGDRIAGALNAAGGGAADAPAQAVGLAAFAKAYAPLYDVVIAQGMPMLAGAFIAVILGAILAAHIRANGVAEQIVRFAAEFGGDSPFALSLVLTLVTALLFTTLGGLGAVIMVATLTLPVLRSVGVPGKTAAVSFLFALSLGGALNPVNWQIYKDILGLDSDTIIRFALAVFGVFAIMTVLYLAFKLARGARSRVAALAITAACALAIIALAKSGALSVAWPYIGLVLTIALIAALIALWLGAIFTFIRELFTGGQTNASTNVGAGGGAGVGARVEAVPSPKPALFAYFAILIPLLHNLADTLLRSISPQYASLGISMPFLAALALGILYSFLASYKWRASNSDLLMRAMFEGFKDAAPAVLLMIGIGMLLKATMLPETAATVQPMLTAVLPRSPIPYVLVFTLLAPLALYRGPLNLWGMGSGIVGIVLGAGLLSAPLVMGAFMSVGMMQGVCDPTNTHNVWIANHEGVDVNDLLKESILFIWALVAVSLTVAALTMPWS
jgi:hypothetical protein